MSKIRVNFAEICGKVKVMNALNNGPAGSRVRSISNFESYSEAEIPYARLHDSAFYSGYGGEWSVDVHRIFRNFEADECDPENYVFTPTDAYLKNIVDSGTKVYYRLGAAIEHGYKYGTVPPKDYLKWARICEHIIRHYTEGWADGFYMDIEYWEIWNEADCHNGDGSTPCWQGTEEEFSEFFVTVYKYLKERFPMLKIGGPAIASVWGATFPDIFFSALKNAGITPDFISYHRYGKTPEDFVATVRRANSHLEKYGYLDVETHLNEWNYVRGWQAENFIHTIESIKGLKGASFTTAVMCALHPEKVDMLMYYEGRPSAFCGLWTTDTLKPLKGYYPFLAFSKLRRLGTAVKTEDGENLYSLAATDGTDGAVLLTYFDEQDGAEKKDLTLEISNFNLSENKRLRVKYLLLDGMHDLECVREEMFTVGDIVCHLDMPPYTTYLIKLETE